MNHTPGPWNRNVKPVSKYPTIFAGRNTHVAAVLPVAEAEANADLIAAAPELAELVRSFADRFPAGDDGVELAASMMLDAQLFAARCLLEQLEATR